MKYANGSSTVVNGISALNGMNYRYRQFIPVSMSTVSRVISIHVCMGHGAMGTMCKAIEGDNPTWINVGYC